MSGGGTVVHNTAFVDAVQISLSYFRVAIINFKAADQVTDGLQGLTQDKE